MTKIKLRFMWVVLEYIQSQLHRGGGVPKERTRRLWVELDNLLHDIEEKIKEV